ncbi:hypothetical protein Tco_0782117 [Tanacetum coccineum]
MQQPMPNPEDITDPTTAMNMALVLMAKQIGSTGYDMGQGQDRCGWLEANGEMIQFRQYAGQNVESKWEREMFVAARAEGNATGNNDSVVDCAQKEEKKEAGINSKRKEFDLMAVQADLDGNEEFLGTVRFGNDHVAAILGFGDLQWGNILITRVFSLRAVLGHNLFSVGHLCDSDYLEVAYRRTPVLLDL